MYSPFLERPPASMGQDKKDVNESHALASAPESRLLIVMHVSPPATTSPLRHIRYFKCPHRKSRLTRVPLYVLNTTFLGSLWPVLVPGSWHHVNRKSFVVCSRPVATSTTLALTPTCYAMIKTRLGLGKSYALQLWLRTAQTTSCIGFENSGVVSIQWRQDERRKCHPRRGTGLGPA